MSQVEEPCGGNLTGRHIAGTGPGGYQHTETLGPNHEIER